MEALKAGKKAPSVELSTTAGHHFSLAEALRKGPVVLAFFKISCPVCQFTFPYLERIFQRTKGTNISVVGVSQNNLKDTQFFARQYGVTFPVVLDDPDRYEVSNAYGLTTVPTIFLISQDGTIEVSCVGFVKDDLLDIAKRLGDATKAPAVPVFAKNEDVPAFRAG